MTDRSKDLFKFYSPDGLYRFNTLVQGVASGSSECHEKLRRILEGLEGVVQIKDDIIVHGKGREHDQLTRLEKFNITLRREKCELGKQEVKWFGHIFNNQWMCGEGSGEGSGY